jgi:uncharacterized membrane protein
MLDSPADVPTLLSLVLAIAAFAFAVRTSNEMARLRRRLEAMEQQPAPPAAISAMPPPIPSRDDELAGASPVAPDQTPEAAAEAITTGAPEHASRPEPAEPPSSDTRPMPPPLAPAEPGFEERIGTRWVVWIGGLTLALGGFFLVRYSIEAGLLGPAVRTVLGGLFALALLIAGESTRRNESVSTIAAPPTANIPAILTAAGTAVAFATIYAAYALYDFLAPASAFVLLGLVALGTLAAALLHGPALAGLGIAGAFITPVLVSSNEPDYWALYIYLAVVTAAAFALARARLWRWLVVTTIALALLWTLPCLDCGPSMVAPHVFHVVTGFLLATLLVVCGFAFGPDIDEGRIEPISSTALTASLLGATLIVLFSNHADAALTSLAVLVAGTLVVAWRAPAATGAVGAAAIFVFIVFAEWAVRGNPDTLVLPGGPLPGIGPAASDGSVTLHLIAAAIFAAGFGAAGFLAQGRASNAAVPVIWSAAATFTPLAVLVALYARIAHLDRSVPFAILAVLLAAAFATATEVLGRRDHRPGLAISIALFATATLGALALALTFALDKGWLTIALSLTSLGAAYVSLTRPIPFLRTLAAGLAGIVVLRIGYEPRIAGDDVGTTPIFNWLLWGYGVPALSFWTASHFLRRRGDDAPLRAVEAAAILFTVLLAFLEIRHAVNGGDIYAAVPQLTEFALQACVTLAMAIGLERLRLRTHSVVHNVGAVVLTVIAGMIGIFGLLLFENPILVPVRIEGDVVNLLLLAYALPSVLMLLLSYAVAGQRRPTYGNTIAAAALIFALVYVTLEIRRLYHGPVLTAGPTTDLEQYTYSIAWLAFGVVLLGIGIAVNSQRARLASAVVIALTILKAFAIDMSALTGVYRALSFIGLGLVLVAIGWLYQKILFRRQLPPVPSPQS